MTEVLYPVKKYKKSITENNPICSPGYFAREETDITVNVFDVSKELIADYTLTFLNTS